MATPANNIQADRINKERSLNNGFDFLTYVHKKLVDKASPNNYLGYSEVYKILGQNFCFKKQTSKHLLSSMHDRGLISKQKRRCLLC